MSLINTVFLVLLGMMAASVFLQAQWPQLKPFLHKLTDYQGTLGVAGVVWSAAWFIVLLIQVGYVFISTLFYVACIAVLLGLGLVLGGQNFNQWLGESQQQRVQQWRERLLPHQTGLGLAALALGALQLLWMVF